MTKRRDSVLPLELRVLAMLRARVPAHRWNARRVVLAIRDFDDIDVWVVSTRCADWLSGPDATRVSDPHAQLRRYFETERTRCAPINQAVRELMDYDRSDVVAAPSTNSSSDGASES